MAPTVTNHGYRVQVENPERFSSAPCLLGSCILSQGSHAWEARGSASWLSSHGRGLGPRDALKKDSRGLCRGAAGNPRASRLERRAESLASPRDEA